MDESKDFNFGSDLVAKSYDSILVPILFEPWAKSIIQENTPWSGKDVLELACGTGVVTKELVSHVLPGGKVIALDINIEMLNLAKLKCSDWADHIEFMVGSADALDVPNNSIDKVVCQQGFQFFPNKKVVAQEIHRVLKPGGTAILSTWSHVSECEIFNAVCEALESLGLNDISQIMRIPFDHLTKQDLFDSFNGIDFSTLQISKQEKKLYLSGGIDSTVTFAYATPIGPKLISLSKSVQEEFKRMFIEKTDLLKDIDGSLGRMTSNVLTIQK